TISPQNVEESRSSVLLQSQHQQFVSLRLQGLSFLMSKGGGQGVIKRTGGEFDFGKSMFGKIQCEEFDRRRKRMFLPNPLQPQAIEGRFSGEVGKNMKSQTAVCQKTGGEIQCVFQVRQMLQHVVTEDHIECLWRKRLELIKAVESL